MKLTPLGNKIAFTFVDRVNSQGQFEPEPSAAGIVFTATLDDSAKQPRWVNVIAVGPGCKEIKPGTQVLLPNLRWTSYFKVGDEKVWQSDESQAAAYRNSPTEPIVPIGSYVVFEQVKPAFVKQSSLLVVVGGTSQNTPRGKVVAVGVDAKAGADIAPGNILYYSDVNFTDNFKHAGSTLAFIKDENILAIDESGV